MASDMASVQFAPSRPSHMHRPEEDREREPASQVGAAHPEYRGPADVAPLGAGMSSSADKMTAWRLKRSGSEPPQPYSKRTSGSIYRFEE